MQIIENWAEIKGVVKSIKKHPDLDNYTQIAVEFEEAKDVEGFSNLATLDLKSTMPINVKNENHLLHDLKVGKEISIKVRKAYGQVYFIKE